ncbi:cleft lip and palate transmembrane protein 1-like protein [Sipha flava]|uniref:Lipid scramblase CLPTM1L n=1 Tax=Sipha flava TaxID=143950 RepID=A0A2S2PXA8_9HEMI|nr:cleft lip and palate transmembrane protein 1-like protein [Sipha flava]XP_025413938.1 cleft lip and palate transmembrane protein 1-like protein [Sipha flava]
MKLPSFTTIVSVLFISYLGNLFYSIWVMVQPPICTSEGLCLKSYLLRKPNLELNIFVSSHSNPRGSEVIFVNNFPIPNYNVSYERMMSVQLPKITKQNGTMFAHVFLSKTQEKLSSSDRWTILLSDPETVYTLVPMSIYKEPEYKVFQLLQDGENVKKNVEKPITHVKAVLPVSMLTEPLHISQIHLPSDIFQYLRFYKNKEYLPIFLHNSLQDRSYNVTKIDKNTLHVPILLRYEPLSYTGLRILTQTQLAMITMQQFGFKNKDIDEIKAIFDTNHYLLLISIIVAFVHILFDFLAFKNDISFWRSRKSMAGLSSRLVIWRAFSQSVILLYLFEEKASMLIIVPSVISSIIEIWKVFKIIPIDWKNLKLKKLTLNRVEEDTKKFDAESMKYLSYVLYPLCVGAAVYSLIYEPQKSWYSWSIKSLVNGVYAFGFLFMLPQLFINYRLKSVAHLPWKTFMYKAFNTFIDDLFAFIIPMPTAHRLACFRDDIVFLIYIYQRWLYPVDRSRLDEDIGELEPSSQEVKTKTD